ncbi:expressed unknown protein [Seminavis robusta]|uniref:Uncharacterized protein n=1 Tax=Seminavis robusta TaxID=568900 RepID=A0A9N8HZE1_9STRA|nr:expressed unknown protein [Seminavis robusta]|eukprot:Sro3530_g348951.1  (292) ;mRNA; r:2371-3246
MRVIYISKKDRYKPGGSPFETHLLPIIADVLEFTDLVTRLHLAATSPTVRNAVFQQERNNSQSTNTVDSVITLWANLNFTAIPGKERLTDKQLWSIFQNVDAVSNVKVLRLGGCHSLRGTCLAALQGSTTLQRVEFWGTSVAITRDFVLRLFRPLLSKSRSRDSEVFIHYAPPRLTLGKTSSFTYRYLTCRDRAICSTCSTQTTEIAMTPCTHCGRDVCGVCCSRIENKDSNHCRRCETMLLCSDCSPVVGFLTSLVSRRMCAPCAGNLAECFSNTQRHEGCFLLPPQQLR